MTAREVVSDRPVAGSGAARPRVGRLTAIDLAVVALLAAAAFATRLDALPPDGLANDDAWAALGGLKAPLSQLLVVGSNHPGFTAVLMAWDLVAPAGAASMTLPALVAGALGPPLLYLYLRWFRFARSISVLLAAALVVADTHVLYSGRVKTYVIDVLVVMALTVLVARLGRVRWRWPLAVAWAVCGVLFGTFSAFALVASAGAGLVLLVHPVGDRALRSVAVAAQGLGQLAYLVAVQRTYDASQLEGDWERLYDGYVELDANPLQVVSQLLEHLGRVAEVFPVGPSPVAAVIVGTIAVSGLVLVARGSMRGRYVALLLAVACAGGIAGRFPFGPSEGIGSRSSVGGRATLWLVPVVAVGVAGALQWLRSTTASHPRLRTAFDALSCAGAVLVILLGIGGTAAYPFSGSESATHFVEDELGADDVVLVLPGGFHSFGVESAYDVDMRATPTELVGYVPEFEDRRIRLLSLGKQGLCERVRDLTAGTDRVLVHQAIKVFLAQQVASFEEELLAAGFEEQRAVSFDDASVTVWRRAGAAGRASC